MPQASANKKEREKRMIRDQAKQIAERYAEAYVEVYETLHSSGTDVGFSFPHEAQHAIALHLALQEPAAPPVVQEPPAPVTSLLRRVECLVHETAPGDPLPPIAQLAQQLHARPADVSQCLQELGCTQRMVAKERVKGAPAYVRRWVRCGLTRSKE